MPCRVYLKLRCVRISGLGHAVCRQGLRGCECERYTNNLVGSGLMI
jgi:hypothetical protein